MWHTNLEVMWFLTMIEMTFCTREFESPFANDFSRCSFDIILLFFDFQDLGQKDLGTTTLNILTSWSCMIRNNPAPSLFSAPPRYLNTPISWEASTALFSHCCRRPLTFSQRRSPLPRIMASELNRYAEEHRNSTLKIMSNIPSSSSSRVVPNVNDNYLQ